MAADNSLPAEEFTNKQGSPTSICAHEGCGNIISASGDTAFCTEHSGKCSGCGCYVDENVSLCTACKIKLMDSAEDFVFASNTYEFNG